MAALITILLLSLVFIVSLLNIMFTFYPTNRTKLYGWLQSFSTIHKNSYFTSKDPFLAKETTGKIAGGGNSGGTVDYCKKVFATFDKDGDGFITRRELRESFKGMRIAMTDEELEELVAKSDQNRDGFIDFGEFCKLLEEANMVGAGDGVEEEEEEEMGLKEAFDVFDKDKDGLISVEELGMVLSSMGLISEVDRCMEMISKVDMDGDGMVNFDEFKRMMMISK